ncbi:MAG: hypothetical protein HYS87_02910 [Candidatus Colwellbacteria bacterium]|nr:hypothetical protein [Candidatus Colwellbacteria bacterium]
MEKKFFENREEPKQEVIFDKTKGTLLLEVDKNKLGVEALRDEAIARNLNEKNTFHLTVIGSDTAEKIVKSLAGHSGDEIAAVLFKIEDLARKVKWNVDLKPEFYYVTKEYNDASSEDPEQLIKEMRESIIQIADANGIAEFYDELKNLTGLEFELPMPHVTLFTNSTRPDKKLRGIGIYSREEFQEMNPIKIEV